MKVFFSDALKLIAGHVVPAMEKHAAFVRARGRHYSGEAEAMRRAKQLLDKEEDEDDKMVSDRGEEVEELLKDEPGAPKVNGT